MPTEKSIDFSRNYTTVDANRQVKIQAEPTLVTAWNKKGAAVQELPSVVGDNICLIAINVSDFLTDGTDGTDDEVEAVVTAMLQVTDKILGVHIAQTLTVPEDVTGYRRHVLSVLHNRYDRLSQAPRTPRREA